MLNTLICSEFQNFQNSPEFCQPASQPVSQPAVRPGCAKCRGPEILHDKGVMAADLRKCCSEDDLSTAPWRFVLSFFPFLVLLYPLARCESHL